MSAILKLSMAKIYKYTKYTAQCIHCTVCHSRTSAI